MTATTGVYLNSLSSTYPALSLNGGPSMTANIQEWKTYTGTVLSLVDSQGKFAINRTSAVYQLDVRGSGRFDAVVFGDGTVQTTAARTALLVYRNVSTAYTLAPSDDVIFLDPSSNDVVINLPSASGLGGKEFYFKRKTGSYSTVINASGSQTIDGEANFQANYNYEAFSIISDNNNWYVF